MKIFWNSIACIAVLTFGSVFAYAATVNGGNPVPYLVNDAASVQFIAGILTKETNADQDEIQKYSRKFIATISGLSPDAQNVVWYGAASLPTLPVDPTDPTDPTLPTDPTDPTLPTDPTDPTDPTAPKTTAELLALLNQSPPLNGGLLMNYLYDSSPLSSTILLEVVAANNPMSSAHRWQVLYANLPLPPNVVLELTVGKTKLNKLHTQDVLAAHAAALAQSK